MKHESAFRSVSPKFSSEKKSVTSLIFSQQRITISPEQPVNLDKFIIGVLRFSGAEERQEEGAVQ